MAVRVSLLILEFAAAYLIYSLASRIISSFYTASKAKRLNCLSPPKEKNRLPFGIDQIQRALKALDDKSFPTFFIERVKEVGSLTFSTAILGTKGLFTADEANLQAILATQFEDFDLGEVRRQNALPMLGSGIFTQDRKEWERSRALMRPQFSRQQISDLEIEEKHVQNLMKTISLTSKNGWTDEVDLQPLLFNLSLDSATEVFLGKSANSQLTLLKTLEGNIPVTSDMDVDDFGTAFDKGMAGLATRLRFAPYCWLVWPKGFMKANKTCQAWVDDIVQSRLSKTKEENEKKLKDTDKKQRYIFLDALAEQTQDPIELRSQVLNLLLAGRDTTSSLIGWVIFRLVRDQERLQKLRNIIIQDFGTYADCNPATDITFSKIKSCKYLQYCLNETLRLDNLVPFNFRVANKDTTLPRGGGKDGKSKIFVPRGTQVDYSIHVLHRRRDIWGPAADEFTPERWEGRKLSWEFIPFNGGPRICLGQQYGLTESSYVIIRLLQRYDKWTNMDIDPMTRYNVTLTNCSANGVKVKVHET